MQVKFLYLDLDISSCDYFKDIYDRQLVGKPPIGNNIVKTKAGDQTRPSKDLIDLAAYGEDQADDSPIAD